MSAEVAPGAKSGESSPRVSTSLWQRYRGFFLAPNTLVTLGNALLLVAGAIGQWVLADMGLANGLYAASAVVGGFPVFILAGKGICKGNLTAGVMVSVAMIAALIIGEYSAAALVAFMMMFGEMLENLAMARSDQALKALAGLIPLQVTILRDGEPALIQMNQVQLGDVILVRNGERIPVDGLVSAGQAAVNESAITGESVPVDKSVGSTVFAGTINVAGTLEVVTHKIGADTVLGTIVKLVEEARKTQAPVQRLANRYAQILVPVTFSIAIVVYLITGELVRSVTVLVVVCPCALVLATPTALVAAIGNAARNNVIVKTGSHMEALGKLDVVAFDKTGTLTTGQPEVVDVVSLNGLTRDQVMHYAACAEQYSEHPLGRAIVDCASASGVVIRTPDDTQVRAGFGVQAMCDGKRITVGNNALLEASCIRGDADWRTREAHMESRGHTAIFVAVDREVVGLIALADRIRPEANEAIRGLKAAGVRKTVMITGDNCDTARAVAATLGIDEYHARMLPEQKLDLIRELQAGGLRVAYVGDGVNDAPSLAVADVGIAMGAAGTDLAIETADVALMTDDMRKLPFLLGLSKETLRTIRTSVIFSMSMNVLSLVLSMLGVIGPAMGAVMHELSALPVLAYSARLVSYREPSGRGA
jgi:Cd2+/Zn2+-exporting ATPase